MSDRLLPPPSPVDGPLPREEGDSAFWKLVESFSGAVVVTDGARRVRDWTAQALELPGFDPQVSVGRDVLTLPPFALSSEVGRLVNDLFNGARASDGWFLYTDDGHGVTLLTLGDEAAPQGYVVVVKKQGPSAKRLREKEKELERLNQRLLYDALHDVLTGLPNRTLLLDRLEQVLNRRQQEPSRDAALLFLDFDRFKIINDSLGHSVGDAMLKAIASTLQAVVRPEDTVARLGGDEFVILMDHIENPRQATDLAERIKATLTEPLEVEDRQIFTSASIGIVPSVSGYANANEVLRDADTAMYAAKDAGRGRHQVFDSRMRNAALAALDLENGLWRALSDDQFRVRYLPIVRLEDGHVVGVSAQIRWLHPKKGLLHPKEFLHTATEMGIGRDIDRLVWRRATLAAKWWRERLGRDLLLSLHFNARHFLSPEPEAKLLDTLEETGADFHQTAIELQEGTLHETDDVALHSLSKIVGEGVKLHLDNFGSGHYSLYTIQRFNVGAVKVDRQLVQSLDDPGSAELIRTICAMASNMRLDVIAKGVTTRRHRDRLRELGCTHAQGPLFPGPLDANEVEEYLKR